MPACTCFFMAVPENKPRPRLTNAAPWARRSRAPVARHPDRLMARARRKFLRHFRKGFRDETYLGWERDYKWNAHLRWQENLNETSLRRSVANGQFDKVARLASAIEVPHQSSVFV